MVEIESCYSLEAVIARESENDNMLCLTQCMPNDKATAFALILEANISGRRRAGTGPAPSEKDST